MKKFLSLILAIVSIIIFTSCNQESLVSGNFEIHIIDVGQGDAILLLTPEGDVTLIDSGPYKSYDKLRAYLLGMGIRSFSKVIATHPDSDHIGSMAEIITDFNVEEFYMPNKEHTTTSYKLMIEALEKNNVPVIKSYAGDSLNLSTEVTGSFLSPKNQSYSENNLYSLVLYLEYKENNFLFMGDAELENEYDILGTYEDLKVDFIKLGHHGSKSSSSEALLSSLNPHVASVSLGKGNSFGHPHKEVVETLEKLKIPLYRTDEQGSLIFVSDGKTILSNQKTPGSYSYGVK